MFITRTPLRISFLGGGTDYPDHYRKAGGQTLGGPYVRFPTLSSVGALNITFNNARTGTIVWPGGTGMASDGLGGSDSLIGIEALGGSGFGDTLVMANVDRSRRNTNLLIWHRSLWAIDHGACLRFHHSWGDPQRFASRAVVLTGLNGSGKEGDPVPEALSQSEESM